MGQSDHGDHEHEAFVEEQNKLADVIQHINENHDQLIKQMETGTAANQQAADALRMILQENDEVLHSGLDQPYFGRLDYLQTGGANSALAPADTEFNDPNTSLKTIYVGVTYIPGKDGKDVCSWAAPVAKLWYTPSYESGYTAPKGYIPTKVSLKRHLRIQDRKLEGLNDIFRRQLPVPMTAKQDLLKEALSGVGDEDGFLQVIVETIEPDQYENIANVSDKVLIVQGAAGSGKSEIGLHRIAYLLSPHSDIGENERPTPNTTLFVGPSQAFLDYAADILPTLGIREGVHEVKFSTWLTNQLSRRLSFSPRIWNELLSRGEVRRFNERAETFKGSLAMADVIERHVREMANETKRRCAKLRPLVDPYTGARVSRDEVRSVVNNVLRGAGKDGRLNRRRETFVDHITSIVWSIGRYDRSLRGEEARQRRNRIRNRVVIPWCDTGWPRVEFREEYVSLLSDSEKMVRLAKGALASRDAEALAASASDVSRRGFDDSDLGALVFLDHMLNETIQSTYRHIVVDEAQDISPIEFKLLAISSANKWFTVLGDTAQRLTPYRGIRIWRDVHRVFGRAEIAVQHARSSYRSTKAHYGVQQQNTQDIRQKCPSAYPIRERWSPSPV